MSSCTCCGVHDRAHSSDATALDVVQCVEQGPESHTLCAEDDRLDDVDTHSSSCYQDDEYEYAVVIDQEEVETTIATLQLQVRALSKYKSNYELLCSQLGELNAQIGLQLQRHEADVSALQASRADLETEKVVLEAQLSDVLQALTVQRDAAKQDREYSEHVRRQLSTAAELLKTTENRLELQEQRYTAEIEQLKLQVAAENEDRAQYQELVKKLEEEIVAFRAREVAAKEQEVLRRQRETSKHKQELMARASKVRAVSDELEAQRSALRAAKKHVAQVQTDNDALRKQLANVKRDGTHLSDIIDSQRVEYASYTDELVQTKNAKKQLLKRVAGLTQQVGQLHNEVADAKDDLSKNNELKNCQNDLTSVLAELQHISHAFDEGNCSSDKVMQQVETRQNAESNQYAKDKIEKQEKRVSRERKYRKELARMRELLEDNQQRASESSKGVQNLRRELLSVQKLLHGCTSEGGNTPTPIDQWAEALRNSVKANTLGV